MKIRPSFKIFQIMILCGGMLVMSAPELIAKETFSQLLRKQSKALVRVQSFNAYDPKGTTAEDRKLALFMTAGRAKPLGYSRDGSGVIIDPRGIIVANHHTVSNASRVSVTFFDGTQASARLVYTVPDSDLAFLSVDPPFELDYIPLANSDKVSVGSRVYAIGRALGHNGSVYGGKVSGVYQQHPIYPMRQSLLQVNFGFRFFFGDSGSPLLDRKGYLLGIVSAARRDGDQAVLIVASNVIRDSYRQIPFAY